MNTNGKPDGSDATGTWDRMGIDPLTGLFNRTRLDSLEGSFGARSIPWSAILVDVDHFKLINDIYGHMEGDRVLRQTALTIQVNLKKTDIAVRFGGDEIVIVLPGTTGDGALSLAERLMTEVGRCSYPSGVKVSLSMGISQSRESDPSLAELLSRADRALYRAKETGRGRFYFFTEEVAESDAPDIHFLHMVGRRQELQKLRQLLEETVTDSSRFALLTGETGVGKSRLVDELLQYCEFMRVLVVRSASADDVRHQPYDILLQPLRQALDMLTERELEVVRRRTGPVHPATGELFPGLRATLLDDTTFFREERLGFRIYQDVALLVSAISSMRPLAVILDGLHRLSEPDLGILTYVVRNTPESHVLFLGMMRRGDDRDGVFEKLLAIRSSIPLLHVELGQLSPRESRNMILFALKDPNVPEALQEFLIRQSGGNPLFLRELISALVDSGHIGTSRSGEKVYKLPQDLDIPDSLGQIITIRLRNIDSEARDLLRIASLSPDHLTLSLLESVVGGDPILLARRLDSCIKAGLLEEAREGRSEVGFSFTHGAVRGFLSRELPESMKLTYHRRIAAYFEEFCHAGRDDLLTTVAYHYTRSRDERNAARYSLAAAGQATSRGANRDAIFWYREFLDRIGSGTVESGTLFRAHLHLGTLLAITADTDGAETHLRKALELAGGPEEEAAVQFQLGRSYQARSMYPEAMGCFERAIDLCAASGSDGRAVLGTSIEAHLQAAHICRIRGDFEEALRRLDETGRLLDRLGDPSRDDLRALHLTRTADVLSERGESREALELYGTALDLCRKAGDLQGEALILNNMHGEYSNLGDYGKAMDTLEEVVRLNRRLDDRLGLAIAYYNVAEHHLQLNMLDLAREYYGMYLELNDEIGNVLGIGFGRYGLGFLHLLEGDLAESERCLREAMEVFERLECSETLSDCRLRLARILLRTSRAAEAESLVALTERDEHTPSIGSEIAYVRGLLAMSRGDPGTSVVFFRRSLESRQDRLDAPAAALRFTGLASALGLLGDADAEREALEEGVAMLEGELERIHPYSARNSILSRPEIQDLRDVLSRRGVAMPSGWRDCLPIR